jgi:hypothetical protein
MTDDAKPTPPKRRDDSEKGLSLEVARLFGLSPRDLVAPKRPPAAEPPDAEAPDAEAPNGPAPDDQAGAEPGPSTDQPAGSE